MAFKNVRFKYVEPTKINDQFILKGWVRKGFWVLLNKDPARTLLHSPLELSSITITV